MVEASDSAPGETLPTVLLISTPATQTEIDTLGASKLVNALKLKQGDKFDSERGIWTIVTNYYNAKVQVEVWALESALASMDTLLEKQIQSVIYYIEDVTEFESNATLGDLVRRFNEDCGALEAGFILHNTPERSTGDEVAQKMDEAIADGMLEYLVDDLAGLTAEDKNTGGLLAQDEKQGVERLIEGLQLVPWASMEQASKPMLSKLPAAVAATEVSKPAVVAEAEGAVSSAEEAKSAQAARPVLLQRPKLDQQELRDEREGDNDEDEVKRRMQEIEAARNQEIEGMQLMPDDEDLTEQERKAESMIGLMQDIKRVQVASKDEGLSDQERRSRAEEMILKIAQMMDLGDDDESEGDEDVWQQLKAASQSKNPTQ